MFEKNMQDLVKGIRSAKGDVNVYISQAMQDIKNELKSTDQFLKAEAVRKLTYLHMLGYDMTWAAFHIVEVMSYERFSHKRIGYTAASQSFTQTTDVVLLCTNLLKKEFGSINEHEVGLAVNVLANIATTDLARDLLGDVVAMMNSPKSYVRKKATLVLYKVFLRYPQGLRLTFDKLKERMEEPDVSVVSCAVNVICELANKKPKNYLGLAPQFFRLLTTSSNNWMLIKVVKLMASLVPEEPRLARKLLDPLATIIQNTPAKSLLYECIATVTTALLYTKKSDGSQPRNVQAVVRLCNDHLRRFIEDTDQNLRYLGLVGLSNLMESHPFVIGEHQALIIECLAVDDITIRMRSLELLAGMITPDNAAGIIRELMRQTLSADGIYRHELIRRILSVCSANKYENIHDFDWYIHVLVQLARVPSSNTAFTLDPASAASAGLKSSIYSDDPSATSHGVEVARQLIDIAVRVKSVRSVMVDNMIDLLLEKDALSGPGASTLCEVFYAAAWITGEYVTEYLDDNDDDDDDDDDDESDDDEKETEEEKLEHIQDLVDEMLQPRTTSLPAHVQTVYIQTLLKFVTAMADRADDATLEKLAELVLERLPAFVQSEHIEVQERAVALQQILLSLGLGFGALSNDERAARAFDSSISLDASARVSILSSYFAERLAPVGAKAQRKVPLPGDLDLDVAFSSSEASFLESGGDFSSFANEDDLEVSFVQQQQQYQQQPLDSTSGYSGIGGFSESPRKKKSKKKTSRSRRGSMDSRSGGSSSEHDSEAEREREKERLRKDPFYLSGANNNSASDALGQSGFAEIMDALATTGKKGKKNAKKISKKPKAVYEDDLMPDGARSSDDDRRRSRKNKNKRAGRDDDDDDDDLSAIDLTMPLRDDERIPDQHLYHRQTKEYELEEEEGESSTKKKSKKSKDTKKKSKKSSSKDKDERSKSSKSSKTKHSSKRMDESEGEDDEEEEETKKKSKKTTTNSKKTSSSKRHEDEAKENIYGNVSSGDDDDDDRRHKSHKSKKTKSKSSKRVSGEAGESERGGLKEKKSSSSSKKKSSSKDKLNNKSQAANDEPLLLF